MPHIDTTNPIYIFASTYTHPSAHRDNVCTVHAGQYAGYQFEWAFISEGNIRIAGDAWLILQNWVAVRV